MGIISRLLNTKASRAAGALMPVGGARAVWTPDRYDALARNGYEQNVWVNRCINQIATSAAGVMWYAARRQSDGQRIRIEPTPQALRAPGIGYLLNVMERPNPLQSWGTLIEATFGFWHVAGNYYLEGVGNGDNGPDTPIMELWTQRPDRMAVVPHPVERVGGYLLRNGGKEVSFEKHQILHGAFWHPTNDFYGLSPVRAASTAVDAHNAARAWNVALLQNTARPSGALVVDGPMDDNTYNQLDDELTKRLKKKRNSRPMILSGGVDWKQMSLTPAEMDWLQGMKLSAREIAAIFGVPPELIGDSESKTYANYREARQAFYEETMLPLVDRFRDDVNAWLCPRYGDDILIDYDKDAIVALQENADAVWKRATEAFVSGGITRDEYRQEIKKKPIDNADVFYTDITQRGESLQPATGKTIATAPTRVEVKAFGLETEEQKAAYWKGQAAQRVKVADRVERALMERFADELAAIETAVKNATPSYAVDAAMQAVDLDAWAATVVATMTATVETFGERVLSGLKASSGNGLEHKAVDPTQTYDVFNTLAAAYVEEYAPMQVANITNTTRKQIAEVIGTGLREGRTIPEIAAAVRTKGEEFAGRRAIVIARTETLGASSAGGHLMAKATGIPMQKEWLSTRDGRTRSIPRGDAFDHTVVDGQKRMLDERYDVSGEKLLFPGDPTGSVGNIIQCRCTEAFHPITG